MNINELRRRLLDAGCRTVVAKALAPNDNSKNQFYLGADFTAINLLPLSEIKVDSSDRASSRRERLKATVQLRWLDGDGVFRPANLILYPRYPEVRLSGLLGRSKNSADDAQRNLVNSRTSGRLLFFGITGTGKIITHITGPRSQLAASFREERDSLGFELEGVFYRVPLDTKKVSSYELLISSLREIVEQGWITSRRLDACGNSLPCKSSNCGGFTLEAALGIRPNSFAEPDFEGWEVKQFGVRNLENLSSVPITLMTPEPDGGFYNSEGVIPFIRRFGYKDKKGRPDRLNFGGVHKTGKQHHLTDLTLNLVGYDPLQPTIWDPNGQIALVTPEDEVAASWSFASLLGHWNRKHARAVFVRSIRRKNGEQKYRYGSKISLGIGTDFGLFLKAFQNHILYYDPGIKLEKASSKSPKSKRRSQFRIKSPDLKGLYREFCEVDLNTDT